MEEDLEGSVPDWVNPEQDPETPPETVVFEGAPNAPETGEPQQIYVQAGQFGPGGIMPQTNAVLALVLSILGIMMCSVCTAVPGLIVANSALATTSQYPGHPDQGMAKAAQIISWIGIALFILIIMLYGGLFALLFASGDI